MSVFGIVSFVFFVSRLRILQVSPLATSKLIIFATTSTSTTSIRATPNRTGKAYWTLHSSLLSISPWVLMLLCLRTLILSLPRSDCGSTAGASTNRSILQSEKRPKIILNTYSEVFGAAYGYRLFFWTVLLSCLEEG